jgi:L-methionine (R)-S-oxide reductase
MDERRHRRYERIYHQLDELITSKSPNLCAAMATICAVLHAKMAHHFWTGFYVVASDQELHVGPYQGPVACQILTGGGVCLHAVNLKQPVVVPDVHAFPGHIACDSRSKSEIVIPILKGSDVVAVLDIDSSRTNDFDQNDIRPLQRILELLVPFL